jgi:integrase
LALQLYTARRHNDVIRMGWQHVRGDELLVRQQKTGTSLVIPIVPELRAGLASVPRTNLTFLMTEYGAPFSAAGFGNLFRQWCNEAGLPRHCSAHGLRKAAARRMAEAGRSANEIAAITGHRSLEEVAHYNNGGSLGGRWG